MGIKVCAFDTCLAAGQKPGRGALSLVRGYAYLATGNAGQAVKVPHNTLGDLLWNSITIA